MGRAHRGSARLLLAFSRLLRDALTAILPSVGPGAHSCLRAHPTSSKASAVEEEEPDGQRLHVECSRLLRTAAPRDDGVILISGVEAARTPPTQPTSSKSFV